MKNSTITIQIIGIFITLITPLKTYGTPLNILDSGYTKKNEKVFLLKNSKEYQFISFKTPLRVNTDGSPLSYHPQDPYGQSKALNNICNAIAVRKNGSSSNLCLNKSTFSEAIQIFESWRDSNYSVIPINYTINWKNVLVVTPKNKPCIFQKGEYAGYFASKTHLTNTKIPVKGECSINEQINSAEIPAIVLMGGKNILTKFNAKVGDLGVAYSPQNNMIVPFIINDSGPPDNLGEGSVALNMKLLGKTNVPKNKKETYSISIDKNILIVIFPNTKDFKLNKTIPYTSQNIESRVNSWLTEAGYTSSTNFINSIKETLE